MENLKRTEAATLARDAQPTGRAGISSAAVFHALLRHERCRSDRDGSEFSLVVFDVSALSSRDRLVQQVANQIRKKMRSIDEVGWIDSQNIGVMLPATNFAGGGRFANRVGAMIPYTVRVYPADWLSGEDPTAGGNGRRAGQSEEAIYKIFSAKAPFWKSSMDVAGSLILIVLFSPLFLLLAVYIKSVSPGRVFYRQKRVGLRGKLFTFIKFRTMHENNDSGAHREYLKELIRSGRPMEKLDADKDTRIIPHAKVIRKMCLDELPQLFNVLRREMSLVGPRPCIPYEAEEYLRWHAHRFDVLPGMTGLWQVSGKNKLSFAQMIRLDISYTNRMSFLLDLKILLLTGPAIMGMVFDATVKRLGVKMLKPTTVSMIDSGEGGSLRDT